MGRCDPNWIIIFFVMHLDAFGEEKVEASTHGTIFTGRTQFAETGSKTFSEHFEASNDVFGHKNFLLI